MNQDFNLLGNSMATIMGALNMKWDESFLEKTIEEYYNTLDMDKLKERGVLDVDKFDILTKENISLIKSAMCFMARKKKNWQFDNKFLFKEAVSFLLKEKEEALEMEITDIIST